MNKFKVGDKVRVVKNVGNAGYNKYIGETFNILEIHSWGFYFRYTLNCPSVTDSANSTWREYELELVEDVKVVNGITKQEFIDKYQGVLVNCRTEELAKEFLALAHEFGWGWSSGDSLIRADNNWYVNKEKTLYRAWFDMEMTYLGDVSGVSESFIVFESVNKLPQLPQPQKSLLKSGDKIVCRDGDVAFVLLEVNTIYCEDKTIYENLLHYKDDLMWSQSFRGNDIMQVYRNGELIMQRTEKSEKEIRIEEIEAEMAKLQKKYDELK